MSKKVSKEKLKTLTLNDYIAKAKQKEKSLTEFKNITLGGNAIVVKKLSDGKILDLMDEMDEDSTMKENILVFKEMVFESVPVLKDKELLKAFELKEPIDIVTKVFEIGEIIKISEDLLDLYGLGDLKDDIKN